MGIEPFVGWWFRLSNVLVVRAFGAVPQIQAELAAAVKLVQYFLCFTGFVACEVLR